MSHPTKIWEQSMGTCSISVALVIRGTARSDSDKQIHAITTPSEISFTNVKGSTVHYVKIIWEKRGITLVLPRWRAKIQIRTHSERTWRRILEKWVNQNLLLTNPGALWPSHLHDIDSDFFGITEDSFFTKEPYTVVSGVFTYSD